MKHIEELFNKRDIIGLEKELASYKDDNNQLHFSIAFHCEDMQEKVKQKIEANEEVIETINQYIRLVNATLTTC